MSTEADQVNKSIHGKGKILVAEDNIMNQKVIQALLRKEGYEVTLTANGKIAIEALEQQAFFSLILDYQMPELDGLQALQKIRSHANSNIRNIPVIFLTAEINQEVLRKIEQLGVSHLLEKPIVPGKLIDAVSQLKSDPSNLGLPIDEMPDTEYLYSITDGNKKLMVELIDIFMEEVPLAIQKMKHSYESDDFETLLQTVHKIKPNYKYVGMKKGEKLLKDLEKDLENRMGRETYLSRIQFLEQITQTFIPHLTREKQLLQQN
ncbi:MAG: response regulator [Bacteroidota bacterium]|nr:response regulator [Bacteroidota bacterium]